MNVTTVEFTNNNKINKEYHNIYERLQRIGKAYYGASINYKAFSKDLTRAQKTLIGLLQKNNPMTLKSKVFFPVNIDGEMVGFCEVDCSRKLLRTEQDRLQQLIDLLLVHSIKSSRHIQNMKDQEYALDQVTAEDNSMENVVFLPNFKSKDAPSEEKVELPEEYRLNESIKPVLKLSLPTFIECRNPDDAFKMARELHDLSERFAYIRLQDLDLSTAKTQGLNSFGPITIFVPEISKLTKEQQDIILNYYRKESRSSDSPVLIMASQHPKFVLNESSVINKELLLRQATVTLSMKRNFKHYKDFGIVDYVIESMNKNVIN